MVPSPLHWCTIKTKKGVFYGNIFRKPCDLYRISTSSRGNGPWFSLITPALEKKSLADFAGKKKSSALSHPSTQVSVRCKHVTSIKPYRIWKTLSSWRSLSTFLLLKGKWCAAEGLDNAIMLSDYYDHSFGESIRPLDQWMAPTARAVLVLDADNKVTLRWIPRLSTANQNYDAAIEAVNALG